MGIYMLAQFFQVCMCLRKIFAIRSFAFIQIGNSVKPETVDTHFAPVVEDPEHFFLNPREERTKGFLSQIL